MTGRGDEISSADQQDDADAEDTDQTDRSEASAAVGLLRFGDRLSQDSDIDGAVQAYAKVDKMGDAQGSGAGGTAARPGYRRDGPSPAPGGR